MFEYLVFQEFLSDSSIRGICLEYDCDKVNFQLVGDNSSNRFPEIYCGDSESFVQKLESFHLETWNDSYVEEPGAGLSWTLTYKESGKRCRHIMGSNAFPDCYDAFSRLVYSVTRAC